MGCQISGPVGIGIGSRPADSRRRMWQLTLSACPDLRVPVAGHAMRPPGVTCSVSSVGFVAGRWLVASATPGGGDADFVAA